MDIIPVAITAGNWVWTQFGEQIKTSFLNSLKIEIEKAKRKENLQKIYSTWMQFKWGDAINNYLGNLYILYGHTRVLGSSEPIKIEQIYTSVNILERPQAFLRYNILDLQKEEIEPSAIPQEKSVSGFKLLTTNKAHRLYILGKPGAGKTTFMRSIIIECIKGNIVKIPMFITIKDFADSEMDLMDFICHQFEICEFPNASQIIEYLLITGKAIVLFDGLDEVPFEGQLRTKITNKIHDFSKSYLRTQIIITCRVAADYYSFDEFTYVEIADFNDKQINKYVRNWFSNSSRKATTFLKELRKIENERVLELGRSPLLLSMICLAYNDTLQIPQRRIELYEEAIEALLKRWDATKNVFRDNIYRQLSLGRKRQLFAYLAAKTFEEGKYFFHEKELSEQIEGYLQNLPISDIIEDPDGIAVLKSISAQHGLLIERAKCIYSFSHLTFQEYFTAKYIIDNGSDIILNKLMTHISDSRWREVFLLTASSLFNADHFIKLMSQNCDQTLMRTSTISRIYSWTIEKGQDKSVYHHLRNSYFYLYMELLTIFDQTRSDTTAKYLEVAIKECQILLSGFDFPFDISTIRPIHKIPSIARNKMEQSQALAFARDIIPDLESIFSSCENLIKYFDSSKGNGDKNTSKIFMNFIIVNYLGIAKIFSITGNLRPIKEYYDTFVLFHKYVIDTISKMNPSIGKEFSDNSFPNKNDSLSQWKKYYQQTKKIMIEKFSIGGSWNLSLDEIDSLTKYIRSITLFFSCFSIAYISDREKILNQFLLK